MKSVEKRNTTKTQFYDKVSCAHDEEKFIFTRPLHSSSEAK